MKLSHLLFAIFITAGINGYSQNILTDVSLIKNDSSSFEGSNYYRGDKSTNNKDPIEFRHNSFIAKYNPVSLTASALMLLYQHIISPQFSRRCLYHRTCSNFSKGAINEFGLIKGVFLSADRILRCNHSAMGDIPSDKFDSEGYAIDEPEKYHIRKK